MHEAHLCIGLPGEVLKKIYFKHIYLRTIPRSIGNKYFKIENL
jgi:hypothetical protein